MNIGMAGYGKMGKGIFNLFSSLNQAITVWLRDGEKAKGFQRHIDLRLRRALKNGIITQEQYREKTAGLRFTDRFNDLGGCDLVIESIVEDFQEKVMLLRKLESILSSRALILTNTSFLSITEMAGKLEHGERFCGFHFFYPIPLIKVVEIIQWDRVARETTEALIAFTHELGQIPVIVRDTPGSLINYVLGYYYCEGLYMLEQGLATPSQIDRAAMEFARVGPCESLDIIGIRFVTSALEGTIQLLKEGMVIPDLLYKLIVEDRLGRDWGKGLYIHQGERMEDEGREFYVNAHQKHSCQSLNQDEAAISKRLLYAIFNGFLSCPSMGESQKKALDVGIKEVLGMRNSPLSIMEFMGMDMVGRGFDFLTKYVGSRFSQ